MLELKWEDLNMFNAFDAFFYPCMVLMRVMTESGLQRLSKNW